MLLHKKNPKTVTDQESSQSGLRLTYPWTKHVFMDGCDWLNCQKVHQIQIIPGVIKFQIKGF